MNRPRVHPLHEVVNKRSLVLEPASEKRSRRSEAYRSMTSASQRRSEGESQRGMVGHRSAQLTQLGWIRSASADDGGWLGGPYSTSRET